MNRPQAGFTLIEVVCSVALLALGAAALFAAITAFAPYTAQQSGPARAAAALLAEQTLRIAQDSWKYGPPALPAEATWTSRVPISEPGRVQTSAPVGITVRVQPNGFSAAIEVRVSYTPDPRRSGDSGIVDVTGALTAIAPLPGSTILHPGFVPAPQGV